MCEKSKAEKKKRIPDWKCAESTNHDWKIITGLVAHVLNEQFNHALYLTFSWKGSDN